eukprot:6069659-Prymnesium_polylepis.1
MPRWRSSDTAAAAFSPSPQMRLRAAHTGAGKGKIFARAFRLHPSPSTCSGEAAPHRSLRAPRMAS